MTADDVRLADLEHDAIEARISAYADAHRCSWAIASAALYPEQGE